MQDVTQARAPRARGMSDRRSSACCSGSSHARPSLSGAASATRPAHVPTPRVTDSTRWQMYPWRRHPVRWRPTGLKSRPLMMAGAGPNLRDDGHVAPGVTGGGSRFAFPQPKPLATLASLRAGSTPGKWHGQRRIPALVFTKDRPRLGGTPGSVCDNPRPPDPRQGVLQ